MNFLMEAVCRDGLPDTLSVEARFLRPVFWDDAINVEAGAIRMVRFRNSARLTEMARQLPICA